MKIKNLFLFFVLALVMSSSAFAISRDDFDKNIDMNEVNTFVTRQMGRCNFCKSTFVFAKVYNIEDDMNVKFYCDGELVLEDDVEETNYYFNIHDKLPSYCDGKVTAELYIGEYKIEDPVKVVKKKFWFYDKYYFKFNGTTEVPEFGTIGAAVAVLGAVVVVGVSRKR
ncbi:MAG: hypothetical protein ACLFPQ_01580 [Candidatus Woesearchaeota archaeon]